MTKNLSTYVFPEINSQKDLAIIDFDLRILDTELKKQKAFGPNDVGSILFDNKAYNEKLNKINVLEKEKKELINKSKMLKLKFTPLDHNEMTIGQIKSGLYIDTQLMFNELLNLSVFNFSNIYEIISKKYRPLTLLCILLAFFIIVYILVQ
jgi:hypothetical protein